MAPTAAAPTFAQRALSTTAARRSGQSPALPVHISSTGTGTLQTVTVPGKAYTFAADTYPVLGGTDAAPSPVVYSLASLSACSQVTGHVVARDLGIRLGGWRVDVAARLPTATLVSGAEGNPNWESVAVTLRVQTDLAGGGTAAEEEERFRHFASEVERRCPITQLFKLSGVRYESEWVNEKL
ncbi:hypothetical protein BT67DRAFT_374491 [Trichocladium antarcticum]|uniref:OsmC family protein n=1 Tax=Trichocladium antarcticum TaxID=1450529 RepID=A0AAN6ZFD9_9PEZI|nr:hypothetical protein BT67DRAFT_374491 [Trichocladium antarcticum]